MENLQGNNTAKNTFTSILGAIFNIILFIVKFVIGRITNSIAITGDAFNNISDAGVSLFAFLGFIHAKRPKDKGHPFGHGRVEYIFGLVISFLILFTAVEIAKTSFHNFIKNEEITYNNSIPAILFFTILVKLFFGIYCKNVFQKTKSSIIKAISQDSLIDAVISTITVISIFTSRFIQFPIDAVMGMATAVWIFISGWGLVLENINLLIGKNPDPELLDKIEKKLTSSKYVAGFHNLLLHDYGESNQYLSVHLEIPFDFDINEVYADIRKICKELYNEFKIELAIQIDMDTK